MGVPHQYQFDLSRFIPGGSEFPLKKLLDLRRIVFKLIPKDQEKRPVIGKKRVDQYCLAILANEKTSTSNIPDKKAVSWVGIGPDSRILHLNEFRKSGRFLDTRATL